MNTREAVKLLVDSGFVVKREGRGSHLILTKGHLTISISEGSKQLSPGMRGKVMSYARKSLKK